MACATAAADFDAAAAAALEADADELDMVSRVGGRDFGGLAGTCVALRQAKKTRQHYLYAPKFRTALRSGGALAVCKMSGH